MAGKRDFKAMEERRLQAQMHLEKGIPQAEVARLTGVSRQSVMRWAAQIRSGGIQALKSVGRAGRKPRLSPEQDQRLAEILKTGPTAAGFKTPLWTLERVARVIRREFNVDCHPTTALRLMRTRLKWNSQKPVGKALERDEVAIQDWKEDTWPALKKKRPKRRERSSLSTKAA